MDFIDKFQKTIVAKKARDESKRTIREWDNLRVYKGFQLNILDTPLRTIKAPIDNVVFRLHYKFTCWVLLVFFALLCFDLMKKNEIRCTSSHPMDSRARVEHIMHTYCYYLSTFTRLNGSLSEDEVYPGVGPSALQEDVVYQTYYQWVPYFLVFQAICFYLPHLAWRRGNLLQYFVDKFQLIEIVRSITIDDIKEHQLKKIEDVEKFVKTKIEKLSEEKKEKLVKQKKKELEEIKLSIEKEVENYKDKVYEEMYDKMKLFDRWFWKLIAFESVNIINLTLQIVLTDVFLGNKFLDLGVKIWTDYNALDLAFPKNAKCSIYNFGPSGTVETRDFTCVLPLNLINEKFFLFLWFWYIFLLIASVATLAYHFTSIIFYKFNHDLDICALVHAYDPYERTPEFHLLKLRKVKPDLNYGQYFFLKSWSMCASCTDTANVLTYISDKPKNISDMPKKLKTTPNETDA